MKCTWATLQDEFYKRKKSLTRRALREEPYEKNNKKDRRLARVTMPFFSEHSECRSNSAFVTGGLVLQPENQIEVNFPLNDARAQVISNKIEQKHSAHTERKFKLV